jgi:hypothetical protein
MDGFSQVAKQLILVCRNRFSSCVQSISLADLPRLRAQRAVADRRRLDGGERGLRLQHQATPLRPAGSRARRRRSTTDASFTQTQASYGNASMVGYPDLGAVQHKEPPQNIPSMGD